MLVKSFLLLAVTASSCCVSAQRNDGAQLYWWQGSLEGKLVKSELSNGAGAPEDLVEVPIYLAARDLADSNGHYWIEDAAVDTRQDIVYATVKEGKLLKMATSGFSFEVLVDDAADHNFNGIALDDDAGLVYWVDETIGVRAVSTEGGAQRTVAALPLLRDICLGEGGEMLYFTDHRAGVGTISLEDGAVAYLETNLAASGVTGISAAFGQLFVGTKSDGIYQLPSGPASVDDASSPAARQLLPLGIEVRCAPPGNCSIPSHLARRLYDES